MEFIELARTRFSCRSYRQRSVEQEKVERIVEAAHAAPTAANRQPVRLVVVDTPAGLAKLGKAGNLHGAPLAIVACVDSGRAWRRPADGMSAALIDSSILVDHMMLEATDLGLGTCWICWFDPAAVRSGLGLPQQLEPASILVAGYAAEKPADPARHARTRIPASQLVIGRA